MGHRPGCGRPCLRRRSASSLQQPCRYPYQDSLSLWRGALKAIQFYWGARERNTDGGRSSGWALRAFFSRPPGPGAGPETDRGCGRELGLWVPEGQRAIPLPAGCACSSPLAGPVAARSVLVADKIERTASAMVQNLQFQDFVSQLLGHAGRQIDALEGVIVGWEAPADTLQRAPLGGW